jgi:glycosyltransferase involved in cell wall biosynthesis
MQLHAVLDLGDTVRFLGFREDVAGVLEDLDIYVSSSTAEGFSLTTVEAMASGVPVVATRSGGPEEIVEDGVTGVLVPTHSPEKLAEAIHELAQDPARRRRMADAARTAAGKRFAIATMLRKYEALYESCLQDRRPRVGAENTDRMPAAQSR